jgi:hypothetical protein
MKTLLIGVTVCSLLNIVSSLAVTSASDIMRMDINGDGAVDASEASQGGMTRGQFAILDKNRDGRINATEIRQQQIPNGEGTLKLIQVPPGKADGPME